MNPLLIAGGAIGGLWLLAESQPANTQPAQQQRAGDAITAAMQALLSKRPIAGVSWSQDAQAPLSATANYGQMLDAMVGAFGRDSSSASKVPTGMSTDQLVELMTAWLAAYDAGRAANHVNFGLVVGESQTPTTAAEIRDQWITCSAVSGASDTLTSLGTAACALASYRDNIATNGVNWSDTIGEITIETFRLVNALASEMDGADFVTPGVGLDEQGWKWSDIPGGLAAAETAVEGAVESAAAAVGGFVLSSTLVWVVVLGFGAYMVLR